MKKIYTGILLSLLPTLTLAAGMDDFLNSLGKWVTTLGKILFAAVVVAFFYGLLLFILSEDKRENGKSIMLWGIVAIFVMASIWGLVTFIQTSTGTNTGSVKTGAEVIPTIK